MKKTNITLAIDDSFFRRRSKDNSVTKFYNVFDSNYKVVESIHEGHGVCTYWSNTTIRKKILKAVRDNKPNQITIHGGIPNGAWVIACTKLIKEIRKISNARIILPVHHHVNYSDAIAEANTKRVCGMFRNCESLSIVKYYRPLGIKYVDTDNRHPTTVCYFIEAVLLYCLLTGIQPKVGNTYKAVQNKEKIVGYISADRGVLPQPTLKKGHTGYRVKALQKWLNGHGQKLKIDGNYGQKTEASVKVVERKCGIKVDGIYGGGTFQAFKKMIK